MSDHALLRYCPDLLAYNRRKTREVMVGNVGIGGGNPVRVQSMITSDTRDTAACVAEVLELADRHDLGSCAARRVGSTPTVPTPSYCHHDNNLKGYSR